MPTAIWTNCEQSCKCSDWDGISDHECNYGHFLCTMQQDWLSPISMTATCMLNKSGLLDQLEKFSRNTPSVSPCVFYGDKGRPNRELFKHLSKYNTRIFGA